MINSIRKSLCVIAAGLAVQAGGQGTFQNLNFEQASQSVTPTPVGGWGGSIDPALAFPGWTVGDNVPGFATVTCYNNLSLGAPAACLMGPNFPNAPGYLPLQGSYSVLLQYFNSVGTAPTLSQTGLIPAGTRSITFLAGRSDITVTLGGVNIPLVPINGSRLAGDIEPFAGSTAQLTFSTISGRPPGETEFAYFDDIRFSTEGVPEPGTLSIFLVGIVLIGYRQSCGHNGK